MAFDHEFEAFLQEMQLGLDAEFGPTPSPKSGRSTPSLTVSRGTPFSPLRSLRFADEPQLYVVADGRLRLGRPTDSPYPTPIRSDGRAVRKVQQALIDLGYPLPLGGDDGFFGQETYQAVLAYKTQFNIRTPSGYLDGIVGRMTIRHLDASFPAGPLPACPVSSPSIAVAEGEYEDSNPAFGIPWVTCDPLLVPTPGGTCDKLLPDQNVLSADGGGGLVAPGLSIFYCINRPHIHLEFSASWEEMLPPGQRPPGQRNRAANTPRYDVSFDAFREENLVPGRNYVRDITVTAPTFANVHFVTLLQRNRIFHVRYSIRES